MYFVAFLILRQNHSQGFWYKTSHNVLLITFLPDKYQLTTVYNQLPTLEETNQKTAVP
jgi:hypothetical protein